ncbi:RDD family protein [Streptomyces sp. NPDC052179]|uniref:RDD family protein n=1 Tax=Streptomyces sp. NPDC052179 TaxID=3155680 RepID=UPI003415591C
MSAPTPAPGDDSPHEGYYPDPSIPGYVRYWNGASWVPGTSRPAPQQAGAAPVTQPSGGASAPRPAAASAAPVEETGPIFFDEVDEASEPGGPGEQGQGGGSRPEPEPASVWQADTSRQTGFGGERDRRVSWGGPEAVSGQPATPAPAAAPVPAPAPASAPVPAPAPVDPRTPGAPDPTRGALPATRESGDTGGRRGDGDRPPTDGTVTIRAVGPGGEARTPRPRDAGPAAGDGTLTIRALAPGTTPQGPQASQAPQTPRPPRIPQTPQAPHAPQPQPQPARPQPHAPAPTHVLPSAQVPAATQGPVQVPGQNAPAPVAPAPWAQQSHQPAQPELQQQQQQPQQPQHAQQQQPQLPPQHQLPPQSHQQMPAQQMPAQQGPAGADQPVVPWKPPVDDPFQQLARAQTSARPAGLGKRFAARLLDTLVLGAVVGAVSFPLVGRALDHIDEKITAAKQSGETVTVWLVDGTTSGLFGAVLGAFLVLGFVLEALPTAKWGRTLGKKLLGLDVRDIESHDSPTMGAALRRWLVYGVLGILVIGVVNVLWCLIDRPWRQCWHDKAARTFVAG